MQRLVQRLILAAAVLVLPGMASATSFTLAELLEEGTTIVSGDKVFSNFSYSFTGDMPTADLVNVIAIDDDGNFGIRFQGLFTDLAGDDSGSDALIGFTVTVLDPGFVISEAHLSANPLAPGDGYMRVQETFDVGPPSLFATAEGNVMKFTDWRSFEPGVTELTILKDIEAFATGDQSVTMSFIDQTFAQVPEPGTALLLGIGLSGLAFAGRPRAS